MSDLVLSSFSGSVLPAFALSHPRVSAGFPSSVWNGYRVQRPVGLVSVTAGVRCDCRRYNLQAENKGNEYGIGSNENKVRQGSDEHCRKREQLHDIQDQDDPVTGEGNKKTEEERQSNPTKLKRVPITGPGKTSKDGAGEGKENKAAEGAQGEKSKKGGDSEDKIQSRAERFGGFQADEAKKAARAAKFGEEEAGSD